MEYVGRAQALVMRDGRILMARHIEHGREYYVLPGGAIEPGETPEEALKRELLEELDLARLAKQKAMTLSGGERRRLEITRAMVTNPSFILLDEPFSGVDPLAVYDVQQIIIKLKNRNLGILITDHNVRETLACVDRAYLMCKGNTVCEGPSDFLVNDPKAREIYLGPNFTI